MLFDVYGRPLPRFYDLTIERRAHAIAVERSAILLRRYRLTKRDFAHEAMRLSHLDDSVGLLDLVPPKRSERMYRHILTGDPT